MNIKQHIDLMRRNMDMERLKYNAIIVVRWVITQISAMKDLQLRRGILRKKMIVMMRALYNWDY